ncbi:MAG TPA: DUF2510 domain-containing protein [Acidimicrobiales bacterium]
MVEGGWHADPLERHELRFWNGTQWTEHVSDRGVQAVDHLGVASMSTAKSDMPQGGWPERSYRVSVDNTVSAKLVLTDAALVATGKGGVLFELPWRSVESASGLGIGNRRSSVVIIPADGDSFFGLTLGLAEGRELVEEIRRRTQLNPPSQGWWGALPGEFGVPCVGRILADAAGQLEPGTGYRGGIWPAGVTITTRSSRYLIRWSVVRDLRVEGIDQVRTRPSVGAVLVFGVLGLAAAKQEAESYVTITTDQGEWVLEVGGVLPSPLRARLSPVLQQRLGDKQSTGTSDTDPIEMIKGLAELRDQGLLSEAEFELKKAELLKRM